MLSRIMWVEIKKFRFIFSTQFFHFSNDQLIITNCFYFIHFSCYFLRHIWKFSIRPTASIEIFFCWIKRNYHWFNSDTQGDSQWVVYWTLLMSQANDFSKIQWKALSGILYPNTISHTGGKSGTSQKIRKHLKLMEQREICCGTIRQYWHKVGSDKCLEMVQGVTTLF